MRGSDPGGRFTIPSEIDRYKNGINEDLRNPAGTQVPWWRFDRAGTKVDDIYDVGIGRHWRGPYTMPVISAHYTQGATFQADRGFYNADLLRLLINIRDLHRIFPNAILQTDEFLRDRVQFNGKTFRPSSTQLDGLVLNRWTIFKVDLIEVKEEEQYNDYDLGSHPDVDDPYDNSDPINPTPVTPTPDPVDPKPDPVDPTPDPVDPTPDPVTPTPTTDATGELPLTLPFTLVASSGKRGGALPLTLPFHLVTTHTFS